MLPVISLHDNCKGHAQLDTLLTNDDGFGEPGSEALKDKLRADTTAFAEGFITITPIEADYTANWKPHANLRFLLRELLLSDSRHYYYR